MDDKYHLPEGWGKQDDTSPWEEKPNISPWAKPAFSASDNLPHDEKIQSIDFSTPWEDNAFNDGEKIEQIDFSSPWLEEPLENEETDFQMQSAVSLEKNQETDFQMQSAVSLEKNQETDFQMQSAVSLEKNQETDFPVQSAVSFEKNQETDFPVQSAVSLEKNQETDFPVQSAVSLEKNQETDFPVQSAVSFEKNQETDFPMQSAVSLEKNQETDFPVQSAVSFEKNQETDFPVQSAVSFEKNQETDFPVQSAVSFEKNQETDFPVQSAVSFEKNQETDFPVQSAVSFEKNEEINFPVQSPSAPNNQNFSPQQNITTPFIQNTSEPNVWNPTQPAPYSTYSNQQVIADKPRSHHAGIIVAIILLMLTILAAVIYLIILPMFKGRVNIADNAAHENNSSQTSTQPETFQVVIPDTTQAPATLPSPTEAPTTQAIATEASTPSYMVITGNNTWETAETKAQEMGGHLASIHSEEEWYAVVEAINQAKTSLPDLKYIWLGATSEIDTNAMTVTFYWIDGSDNSWLMNHNAHWYYNTSLGISEPSGYDINEYKKNGTLIREPYLMMWLPSDSIAWSLNDAPDVSNYSNYKDSNMGYVIKIDSTSTVQYTPPQTTPVSRIAPAATTAPKATTPPSPVSVSSCNVKGEINGKNVSGYTSSYIVDGGSKSTVRDTLGDGWHITAKRTCYSQGTTWYELYDTDDGDYYGWVNANNISFYSENAAAEVTPCYITGEINGTGVAGFTTSYVVNHGSKSTVRDKLGNHWHVTAENMCYSMGIYWYELYDTDDGDYYGWVDSSYIKFYGG